MNDDLVNLVTKVIREQQGCFFDDIARHVLAAIEAAGYVIVRRKYDREYDPDMNPVDDAEFGMNP